MNGLRTSFKRGHVSPLHRLRGITAVEVLIVISIVALLLSLLWPWIVTSRELARRSSCQNNLRQLGTALISYHEAFGHLPPAAVWTTSQLNSLALNHSRRIDLFTQSNWALGVLPFTSHANLVSTLDSNSLIADQKNDVLRNARPAIMYCPSDTFNTSSNSFRFTPDDTTVITFSRGNYAINGGTQCPKDGDGTTSFRTGDQTHLAMNPSTREFRYWGNGIAGFNVYFSLSEFENGTGYLVALEEVRAGVHSIDPRGVWALGQIGGSVTWAHGVNGDCYGPNNQHRKSDDLLDGDLINQSVGAETLQKLRMPCVSYVNFNSQATARSMHPGGVNLSMVDGTVRFVSDAIDPGLWHVIHSRETPRSLISRNLDAAIADSSVKTERLSPTDEDITAPREIKGFDVNTIGMRFVHIPPGEFQMGLPDRGNEYDLPPEVPSHKVRISKSFYMGIHEVTRSQFFQVMGGDPASVKDPINSATGTFPVVQVTWDEANEFCRKLSAMSDEKAAERRYRMPTEAEWEYACRAGSRSPYQFNGERRSDDDTGDAAGILPSLPISAVGSYRPNAFGLFDMRGNAWEWCSDWFERDYYRRSPLSDPKGPAEGHLKVIRGSDWTFIGEGCKLSYAPMQPWKANPFVGFRIICPSAKLESSR